MRRRRSGVLVWSALALLVVTVGGALVGLPALIAYDKAHLTSMDCTVTSVDAGKSSAGAKGAATTLEVLVGTQECGTLSLQWGLTKENLDQTAAALHIGEVYTFEVGGGTVRLMGLLHLFHVTPSVYGFQALT